MISFGIFVQVVHAALSCWQEVTQVCELKPGNETCGSTGVSLLVT